MKSVHLHQASTDENRFSPSQSDPTGSENLGLCLSLHPSSTLRTQMQQRDISIMLHRKKDRQREGNRLAQDNRQPQQTKKSNLGLLTSCCPPQPHSSDKHRNIVQYSCSHPVRLGSWKITWFPCPWDTLLPSEIMAQLSTAHFFPIFGTRFCRTLSPAKHPLLYLNSPCIQRTSQTPKESLLNTEVQSL